ncbi:MAG: hypothetical protein HC873_20135 [Leptolyngbyaceae cyanobacterium SL_1_1]|nr:hypothetical protein [Leptolyngbyaceae cyanobacterium SL_1_1]
MLSTSGEVLGSSSLEAFLQLPSDSLSSVENKLGSAIRQSFLAQAGDVISLNWQLLSQGLTLDSGTSAFISLSRLSSAFEATETQLFSLIPDLSADGPQTFSFTVATAGTYSFGVGITGAESAAGPQLLLDNVILRPKSASTEVPEASTIWGLALLGLGLTGQRLRQRR